MNSKQLLAYNLMNEGKNIFLTGKSGSGKSYIINKFNNDNKHKKVIGVTSLTGTSAILLSGGKTLHSFLGLQLGNRSVESMVMLIHNNKFLKNRWKSLDILIIDEVSMLSPELLEKIEEIARHVRNSKKVFGGIQIILSGDFFQLPVINSDKLCFESSCWNKCIEVVIYLDELMRQRDHDFQMCLNDVRIGVLSEKSLKMLESRINKKLENDKNIIATKLYSLNKNVDAINEKELDKLAKKGEKFFEYNMEIEVFNSKKKDNLIEQFKKNCIASHNLQLCKGAQVMLIINLDIDYELINGSRGVVTGFTPEDKPIVKFLNGCERIIDYFEWNMEDNDLVVLKAVQIPLKIAYAISIHKSQGITLDYLEVDLNDVFCPGMAYVALSRVKTLEGLNILGFDVKKIKSDPKVIEFYKNFE